jgi:hypothetical protein
MKLVGAISTAVLSLSLGIGIPAYAQEQHEQEENKDKSAQEKEQKAQPEKSAKPADAKQEGKNNKPAQNQQHAVAGRIPADRYKANFGREHTFRVSQGEYSSGRFQYGGYWFGFGGAWPSNWLYTQDVYVVEINGVYYLCNASFPGVNLVLSVTI